MITSSFQFQVKNSFSGLLQIVPGLNLDLLKMDTYEMDMEKDALFRGEFAVVKELLEKYPAMNTAKNQCDKLIDLNGPKSTGGTGIKQLRENIAESKLSYEIMDDAAQVTAGPRVNGFNFCLILRLSSSRRSRITSPSTTC